MKHIDTIFAENLAQSVLCEDALLPLLDGLDLVAKVLDETGRVVFCNGALLRLLGCRREEVFGVNWFENFLDDTARAGVVRLFHGVFEARDIELRHQNEVVCKDGTRRLISWNNAPLRDYGGRISGFISIGNDITQSRQTQDALIASQMRFKTAFENASIGMALVSPSDGRFLQVNEALCRLLELDASTLETMTVCDVTHPDEHVKMIDAAEKVLNGSTEAAVFEKRLVRRDGQEIWVLVSASLARDSRGEPLHFISQVSDVSESKRALASLQEVRALNDAVIAGTGDGVFVCDRTLRCLKWNPFMEEMLGQSAARVLGQPLSDCLPKYRDGINAMLQKALHGDVIQSGDFKWTFSDGSNRWLTSTAAPLRADEGEIIGVIGTVYDVTGRKEAEEALKSSEDRLRLTMNQITDSLFVHDIDGTLIDVNQSACRALGYSREELLQLPLQAVAPLYDASRVLALLENGVLPSFESEEKHRDGTLIPVEVSTSLFQTGTRRLVMRQSRDISERRQNAELLLRSNAILEATQEASADGICLVDNDGSVARFNRRFIELWGIPAAHAEEMSRKQQIMSFVLSQLKNPDEFIEHINFLYDNETVSVRDEIALLDGRVFDRYSAPALSPQGVSYGRVWSFSDITQRKQSEQWLEQQAFHDSLTGLPNRALFMDRLSQASAREQRHGQRNALLFLDLDRFKLINDSLGHDAGDQLLTLVAERLRACLRPEDTAARLGGDEFVVLIQGVAALTTVTRVAERVAEALKAPFQLGKHEVYTAASIGIVMTTEQIATPDDLLRSADLAMYRAKSRGGARYELFDDAMGSDAIDHLNLETELRHALERDELFVEYQPIVAMESGRALGAEALVRWNNPARGLVPPADFIPLAETTGLILPIGRRVLQQACLEAYRWASREYSHDARRRAATVSVNLSARQFQQPGLLNEVREALEESGLAPENLMLEITESVVMDDAEATIVTLRDLKNLGVRLAIDDFGTGYSSLAYLRRFPVDILKIDRAFVSKMVREDDEDTAIVRAIVTLAKTLGMKVTAEGVENENQVHLLRSLSCDYAQGFHFSRPISAEKIKPFFGMM